MKLKKIGVREITDICRKSWSRPDPYHLFILSLNVTVNDGPIQ